MAALCLGLLTGCEDSGRQFTEVSGTVTYRGAPVPGGTLLLQPGSGRAVVTMIDRNGRYEVGAPAGNYQVAVVSTAEIPEGVDPWKSKVRLPAPLVPERFGRTETSGVSFSVPERDSDSRTIDISLD
jgi:hypothetical protein